MTWPGRREYVITQRPCKPRWAGVARLIAACEMGGVGGTANILLWNAAGCLRELAIGHRNEATLVAMADALKVKAEAEHAALMACEERKCHEE